MPMTFKALLGSSVLGEPFTISEIGGRLRVDRKDYGRVQAEDTVSVLKGGKVLVNDAERTLQ